MKEALKVLFALIAVLAGVVAIIIMVGNPNFILASLSLTFGILAIIWTVMAHGSLSPGSSLRSYTSYFLACLILIMISSIWNSAAKLFKITGVWSYLEYFFLTLAYLVFVAASYKMYHLGKEFGFQKAAVRIKEAMTATANVEKAAVIKSAKKKSRKKKARKKKS
ncbi:hypothetical protein ACFL6I_22070 [candidate division KSB1 bacterium]